MRYPKICERDECQKPFVGSRHDQKFCSRRCLEKSKNETRKKALEVLRESEGMEIER